MSIWKDKILRQTIIISVIALLVYSFLQWLWPKETIFFIIWIAISVTKSFSAVNPVIVFLTVCILPLTASLFTYYYAQNTVIRYFTLIIFAISLYVIDLILIGAFSINAEMLYPKILLSGQALLSRQ